MSLKHIRRGPIEDLNESIHIGPKTVLHAFASRTIHNETTVVDVVQGDWVSAGEIDIPDFDKRFDVYTLPELAPDAKTKAKRPNPLNRPPRRW